MFAALVGYWDRVLAFMYLSGDNIPFSKIPNLVLKVILEFIGIK